MNEIGLDAADAASWFEYEDQNTFQLVRVSAEAAASFTDALGIPIRRCYVSDAVLDARVAASGVSRTELVQAALPDPGAMMAGDFGEILVYIYHAARNTPQTVLGPVKWRLKQDRRKPCPHSDVLQFILPDWPAATAQDRLICAEVKCKSTAGSFRPLPRAIEGCALDRTSRLSRTLVWLRERALLDGPVGADVEVLNRFINADAHPPAEREFEAVAVVCETFLDETLGDVPAPKDPSYSVIVVTVPQLHAIYNAVFDAAVRDCDPGDGD